MKSGLKNKQKGYKKLNKYEGTDRGQNMSQTENKRVEMKNT